MILPAVVDRSCGLETPKEMRLLGMRFGVPLVVAARHAIWNPVEAGKVKSQDCAMQCGLSKPSEPGC